MNDELRPDLDETDLADPDLGRALRDLAGPSSAMSYDAALPRFRRARLRHRVTVAGVSVAACGLLIAGIAFAQGTGGFSDVRTVPPAGRGTSTPSRPAGTPTSTSTTPTTTVTTTVTTPSTGLVVPTAPSPSTPRSTSPSGPAPHQATYSSAGGSVVVTVGDRVVTLVSTQPAAGYTPDIRAAGPTEVEVRFRMGSSGGIEHRIRLRFDSGGALVPEIT